jgi:hypothetical protein
MFAFAQTERGQSPPEEAVPTRVTAVGSVGSTENKETELEVGFTAKM